MKKMAFVDLCNFKDWPMGGMIRYELMILETLGKFYKIDVWGVSVDGEVNEEITIQDKVYKVHIFANVKRKNRLIPNYWKGLELRKLKEVFLNYDIIYAHTGSCLVSLAKVLDPEKQLLIYHQHGLQYLEDYSLKSILQRPFMNQAQKLADFSFVVTGEEELEDYINKLRPDLKSKMIAIGSPIEETDLTPELDTQKSKDRSIEKSCRFIYTGRLAPIKNVPKLIKIFALFYKRGHDGASLLIVGDGEERSAVCKMIKRYGLQGCVHLTGAVEPKKVREYLIEADVYLTASKGEGASVAVLEAYAAGVPVVCFPVRGLKSQVKNKKTGYVATDMRPEAFVQAMEYAIKDQIELVNNCLQEAGNYQKGKIGQSIVDEIERR